ncbi:MAG: twin-arginine translocase TatA/TatE family subunit [Deltaproteobacteria bacterium]|jgi:sec-independent protein translocase protein TatA|nr:twin-arginine translocase TatA/TatE family subunit [Deltaproteobacteria bacterium]
MLGPWKILLIAAALLLVFGGRRLPDLGRQLGSAISNFRKSVGPPPGAPGKDPGGRGGGEDE